MFKVLLREGMADANATDNDNSTPLHAASQEGKLNVVEILVGLKKNLKNAAFENIIWHPKVPGVFSEIAYTRIIMDYVPRPVKT